MNDSFDADSDFDRTGNNDISAVFAQGIKGQLKGGNQPNRGGNQDQGKTKGRPHGFVGANHPPLKSSISDIVDERDKDALFRSSMGRDPPGQSYGAFMNFGSPLQMSFKSPVGARQNIQE